MVIQEEEKVEIIEEKKQEEFKQIKKEKKNYKVWVYILSFFIVLLCILVLLFGIFTFYNYKNRNVIAKGIYINGIDVSFLTKEEALEKIAPVYENMSKKDIELIYQDYKTYISAEELELKYDPESAINYAFNIGRNNNLFVNNYIIFETMINELNITPTYSLNEKNLISFLENLSKDLPNAVIESSYYIEDSKLIISKGKAGYIVNAIQTSQDVISSIDNFSYLNTPINLSLTYIQPSEIDIDKIYSEVCKEPKDAYYTTNPYVIHPSENGIDFSISLEEAQNKIQESQDECEITLKTTYPKITTNMIGTEAFPDLLATYSTNYYTGNTNRVTNLKLAANKINGTVLMPGETFSYNGVVGKRTIAAGYKEASVYSNGEEVMGLGGGICQISSTLFNAVLYSNLHIIEVNNHQFIPQYSSAGRDATVVYGVKDFQFKNTRNYPIKLTCSVSGGVAKFNIFGLKEENEYDVEVYVNVTSNTETYIKSTTYRRLKQNGKVISNEKIYSCTYKKH